VEDRGLDLSLLTRKRPHPRGFRGNLLQEGVSRINQRLVEDAAPALEGGERIEVAHEIRSQDRAVLATLAGVIARREHTSHLARLEGRPNVHPGVPEGSLRFTFTGSAGQGFAAFATAGLDVTLVGEANDSVAKSMSGGRVVIRPPERASFVPGRNAIIGNAALYGATGGTLFVHGFAGDRFAVRNSGAQAVVEGTGLHACEYMTGGLVVVLGEVSTNVGAGMTGGELFLRRDHSLHVNRESLEMHDLGSPEKDRLRAILEAYAEATDSPVARELLAQGTFEQFVSWRPKRARPVLRAVGA
jgi:glutamate synthase domain-containing protein 3